MAYKWTPDRIKILRLHFAESQPAFAGRLGIALATLRDYEQGRRPVPVLLARLLDCIRDAVEKGHTPDHPDPPHRKPGK